MLSAGTSHLICCTSSAQGPLTCLLLASMCASMAMIFLASSGSPFAASSARLRLSASLLAARVISARRGYVPIRCPVLMRPPAVVLQNVLTIRRWR